MTKCKHKNTINNRDCLLSNRNNMSLIEPRNIAPAGPEYSIIAETQIKHLKTDFMNILKVLKKEKNPPNSLKKSVKTQTVDGN